MTEHQILGAMLGLQTLLTIGGIFLIVQGLRETHAIAEVVRETHELVRLSLDVARELLKEAKS